VVFVESYGGLDDAPEVKDELSEEQRLDQLITLVRQRGQLRADTARLVVMTRAGGFSIEDLATPGAVDPQTLRQQRLRAERRVRQGLSLAM
jgi:hypothetical protein